MNEHRFVGSNAWVRAKERKAETERRNRDEIKEVFALIRFLPEMEVTRINSSGETETGKELDSGIVNHLEILAALNRISEVERRRIWLFTVEEQTVRQIASADEVSDEAVRRCIYRAAERCRWYIYDPEDLTAIA